eukprot:Gb_27357 [translate_table: standard]
MSGSMLGSIMDMHTRGLHRTSPGKPLMPKHFKDKLTLGQILKRYRPQWGVLRELLLANLLNGLYRIELACGEDGNSYLDTDINYKELELSLHLYASTTQESKGEKSTAEDRLRGLIKEIIIPNLSTDMFSLMNEESAPAVPPPLKTSSRKPSVTGTPRRLPSGLVSGRNTPRAL